MHFGARRVAKNGFVPEVDRVMSGSTGLLIVGAVLPFIPVHAVAIVLGAAVAWLGFDRFTGRAALAGPPEQVR